MLIKIRLLKNSPRKSTLRASHNPSFARVPIHIVQPAIWTLVATPGSGTDRNTEGEILTSFDFANLPTLPPPERGECAAVLEGRRQPTVTSVSVLYWDGHARLMQELQYMRILLWECGIQRNILRYDQQKKLNRQVDDDEGIKCSLNFLGKRIVAAHQRNRPVAWLHSFHSGKTNGSNLNGSGYVKTYFMRKVFSVNHLRFWTVDSACIPESAGRLFDQHTCVRDN